MLLWQIGDKENDKTAPEMCVDLFDDRTSSSETTKRDAEQESRQCVLVIWNMRLVVIVVILEGMKQVLALLRM